MRHVACDSRTRKASASSTLHSALSTSSCGRRTISGRHFTAHARLLATQGISPRGRQERGFVQAARITVREDGAGSGRLADNTRPGEQRASVKARLHCSPRGSGFAVSAFPLRGHHRSHTPHHAQQQQQQQGEKHGEQVRQVHRGVRIRSPRRLFQPGPQAIRGTAQDFGQFAKGDVEDGLHIDQRVAPEDRRAFEVESDLGIESVNKRTDRV
jgi:hypothetical protein